MRQQLEDFAAAVRSGTPSRVASLEDAVEGLRIAEAILEALQSGRPVELSLVSAESSPPP
jgi:predicted dehydrogenase